MKGETLEGLEKVEIELGRFTIILMYKVMWKEEGKDAKFRLDPSRIHRV